MRLHEKAFVGWDPWRQSLRQSSLCRELTARCPWNAWKEWGLGRVLQRCKLHWSPVAPQNCVQFGHGHPEKIWCWASHALQSMQSPRKMETVVSYYSQD
jgi:hypothetical protein